MDGLHQFLKRLTDGKVLGEIWANGSFLTEKIDPKDIDLVLRCDGVLYDTGTAEQRDAIDWVVANQKHTLRCDSYVFFEYPSNDPLHAEGEWWRAYWHAKWGFSREEDPKGIVVVILGSAL